VVGILALVFYNDQIVKDYFARLNGTDGAFTVVPVPPAPPAPIVDPVPAPVRDESPASVEEPVVPEPEDPEKPNDSGKAAGE
jgi:hypothetical protein